MAHLRILIGHTPRKELRSKEVKFLMTRKVNIREEIEN